MIEGEGVAEAMGEEAEQPDGCIEGGEQLKLWANGEVVTLSIRQNPLPNLSMDHCQLCVNVC